MINSLNGFIIFSLLLTSAFFVGLLNYLVDYEEGKCDMTYMFQLPQYVRISNDFDWKFKKYKLYYYEEGEPSKSTPVFWGIPVLFVPGNGGSYRQARSLASVALRKAVNKRLPYHFDYFMTDLNEELTGVSGIYLNDQLDYVNRSLYFILKLYKKQRYSPTSVILIGHSMGGVIAKKLAQITDSPIDILITLASPHKRSPIILDHYIEDFYKNVSDSIKSDVTFINLSGGYSDLLVPSTLTASDDNTSLYAVTTHIPRSWTSADHKEILWCKQTVLALTRCLFDSVDRKTNQIMKSAKLRKKIFHHHLIHHPGTKPKMWEKYSEPATFKGDGDWIEKLPRQYSIRLLKGVKTTQWYMIRIVPDPKHEMLTVVVLNMKQADWIFACNAYIPKDAYKICQDGIHLSHLSSINPSFRYKRRSLTINLHDLKRNYSDDLTHVVFRAEPTREPVVFHVDVYNTADRVVDFKLPLWFDFRSQVVIDETPERSIWYRVNLSGLTHVLQSFYVHVKPSKCERETHHATATLIAPWGNEDVHKFFTDEDDGPFHVRLYDSKPDGFNGSAFVKLTLDPTCRYKISIRRSIVGTVGQLARFYTPQLIVNIAAVLLMILKTLLGNLGHSSDNVTFFGALKSGAKPYYVLGLSKIGNAFVSSPIDGSTFFVIPYVLYMVSVGTIWLLSMLVVVWTIFCESTIHKLFLKFLNKTVPFSIVWSDYAIAALQKIPMLVSIGVILLSVNVCGALGLALATIFYFLKITQMSQDYAQEVIFVIVKKYAKRFLKRGDPEPEERSNDVNVSPPIAISFHGVMLLIWLLLTIINAPSLVSWAKNYRYNKYLSPDPSWISGVVTSFCTLPLWQLDFPDPTKKFYVELSYLINGVAVLSLIFANLYVYRLNYFLTAVVSVVVAHQLLAPVSSDNSTTEQKDEDLEKYDNIKSKLE